MTRSIRLFLPYPLDDGVALKYNGIAKTSCSHFEVCQIIRPMFIHPGSQFYESCHGLLFDPELFRDLTNGGRFESKTSCPMSFALQIGVAMFLKMVQGCQLPPFCQNSSSLSRI